jgi:putative addiction module CopG family antidote
MNIVLSPETQKLLEERMRSGRFATPDEAVRAALQTLGEVEGDALEDLDAETQAAIERAEAQGDRGEGMPWEQVRDELRARYLNKP